MHVVYFKVSRELFDGSLCIELRASWKGFLMSKEYLITIQRVYLSFRDVMHKYVHMVRQMSNEIISNKEKSVILGLKVKLIFTSMFEL